jgi:alkylhydroperoxidase/carboxymuconolactone decarboxylase family protein YurZ
VSLGRRGAEKACIAWLAGVAVRDPAILAAAEVSTARNIEASGLDARSHAMVRLAAAVTACDCGGQTAGYEQQVSAALDQGVSLDEIVGVFVALLPMLGAERIAAAAPDVLRVLTRANADLPANRLPGYT